MKNLLEEIIGKHEELALYKKSIKSEDLEKYSRVELKAFVEELSTLRSNEVILSSMINDIIESKKIKEYPELLGPYRYPLLNDIPFITDAQKVKLDKHLGYLSPGHAIFNLSRIGVTSSVAKELMSWLVEHEVAERVYAMNCPECLESTVSELMTNTERLEFEQAIRGQNSSQENTEMLNKLLSWCDECDEFDYQNIEVDKLSYTVRHIMKMEADRTLERISN